MKKIPNKPELPERPTALPGDKIFTDYVLTLEKQAGWMADHIGQLNDALDEKTEQISALISGYRENNEITKLDQFAMAALPIAHDVSKKLSMDVAAAVLAVPVSEFKNEHAMQLLSKYAYDIAEAMLAESQNRQGGA